MFMIVISRCHGDFCLWVVFVFNLPFCLNTFIIAVVNSFETIIVAIVIEAYIISQQHQSLGCQGRDAAKEH